jgi:soluble epoxide hydrolase / lipid-phosphate phosphatase
LSVDQTVTVPSLMLCAEDDVVLSPRMASGMSAHVPDLEMLTIPDCGHWAQQHKPAEVSEAVLGWLKRRFPVQA